MANNINTVIESIFQIFKKEKQLKQAYESMRFISSSTESITPKQEMCWFKISQE